MSALPGVDSGRQLDRQEPDPDRVAQAVLACPTVQGMHGGRFGEVVTYLPGRRVPGVAIRPGRITVSVVGRSTSTAALLLAQVGAAVAPASQGYDVQVIFADIAIDDD